MGVPREKITFNSLHGSQMIFESTEGDDIKINYFNLLGKQYSWTKAQTKWPRPYSRTRLKHPRDDQKYSQEKGSPQFPFFTRTIITKYAAGTGIETLFVVEGEFKAFRGDLEGLDIIGIPSIHGFYNGDIRGKLHEDIQDLIGRCKVNRIVFLADADVLTVHWEQGKDLSKRASSFYSAIKNFRESLELLLVSPQNDLNTVLFMHIHPKYALDAKGLDDLLSKYTAVTPLILKDLKRLHLAEEYFGGSLLNDINTDLKKVFKKLGLNGAREFYDVYKEYIDDRQFLYRGKSFQWDESKQTLDELKSEALYIRVGVKYYKKINTPQAGGETLLNLKEWTRSCIEMDHGRDYIRSIEKFEDWCYVPDHIEYKSSVNGFYNKYYALSHVASPGECKKSIEFINHIFGNQVEQGLDYLQLLYTRPRQILPVLCLVSEERNTGKTTFLNWLTAIFGRNATINRNEDFESQFNSGWAGKLIIAVDETFIDRKKIYERIKSLSTGKTMKVEAKGQDSTDAEFFGKVILCSNNEDSFIPVDDNEIRFWIRKILPYKTEDPQLLTNALIPEIPGFLQFLMDRKLVTPHKTRMWFSKADIQTDALSNIVARNKSYMEKELTEIIRESLLDNDVNEVKFTLSDLQSMLLRNGIREPLFKIKDLLTRKWKLDVKNSTYTRYTHSELGKPDYSTAKGKHYTFTRILVGLDQAVVGEHPKNNNHQPVLELTLNPVDRLIVDDLPF